MSKLPVGDQAKTLWMTCALAACLSITGTNSLAQTATRAAQDAGPDVGAAWEAIPAQGKLQKFARGSTSVPGGGHFQGIQIKFDPVSRRHTVFLSHDSHTVAYLAVVEFAVDSSGEGTILQVHGFPSEGQTPPLRHAGGIQLLGEVLAVGLEDNQLKTRSEVQFWNVAEPSKLVQLKHLTVRRSGEPKDQTAGGVGLVEREHDVLLAVANWDSRAIDIYVTNAKPLADPDCRFEFHARWQADTAAKDNWQPEKFFGTYQAINLVSDGDRKLYLIGFDTTPSGQDVADLFALDTGQAPHKLLRKISRKVMQLAGDNHFRAAGGIWIDGGRLAILSSEAAFGPEVRINIAK